MPKCENCYHKGFCCIKNYGNCNHFKDKSLIVELPCKVGDTVWIIFEKEEAPTSFEVLNVITSRDRITLTFTNKSCFTIWNGYCEDYFGKSIFLSREEAKKALRECGNDG